MTTTRSLQEIKDDIATNVGEIRELREKAKELNAELVEARVRDTKEKGHPWLGKKLKRTTNQRRRRIITQRGTLVIYDLAEHGTLHRLWSSDRGNLVVLSASGKSGTIFGEDSGWELDQ